MVFRTSPWRNNAGLVLISSKTGDNIWSNIKSRPKSSYVNALGFFSGFGVGPFRALLFEERSCVISVETVAGAAAACVTRVVLRAIFGLTGFDDVLVVELKFSFVC